MPASALRQINKSGKLRAGDIFIFVKGFKFPTLAEKFHEWKHTA